MSSQLKLNILIGCTGSVASIKVPILVESFKSLGCSVIVVPTHNSLHFLKSEAVANSKTLDLQQYDPNCSSCSWDKDSSPSEIKSRVNERASQLCIECEVKALYPEIIFATDQEEWSSWKKRGDPVKHIELREWADILLLAPLDANTLAKMAQGLCDNLLTCIIRAWNMKKKLFFCPAMNTQMFTHPFTSKHIDILKGLGFKEIKSVTKTLMCGETGVGGMSEVETILQTIKEYFSTSV